MSLRVLRSHGWGLTALAREFHLNWRTVKREVISEEARRYPERVRPTALTETQLAHVERRLLVCPGIQGTVLHLELETQYGYRGSYPAFARHLRGLRPGRVADPEIRFETDPGRQVQADWAPGAGAAFGPGGGGDHGSATARPVALGPLPGAQDAG